MDLEKESSGNSFKAGKGEGENWGLETGGLGWFGARMNYLHDLVHLLYIEGKVLLTSQKYCESLPERGSWVWKSVVQRKKKILTSWWQTWAWVLWFLMILLCVFTSLLTVIFLVLLLFLISHGFYSISFCFLHVLCISFLFLPLWLFILCCLCYWNLRWNFQGFDCYTTKGQNYKTWILWVF